MWVGNPHVRMIVLVVHFKTKIDYLYIYKIEAKKVLGNATTHRALVLSSWNFNTDPAQYGRWTLVKIIRIGPRVPGLGPYLGRALSFGESFWSFEMRLCGKIWMDSLCCFHLNNGSSIMPAAIFLVASKSNHITHITGVKLNYQKLYVLPKKLG